MRSKNSRPCEFSKPPDQRVYRRLAAIYNKLMMTGSTPPGKMHKQDERARRIFDLLAVRYPDAQTRLHFDNPFQLFVATVLSAQTTDEQVNKITGKLFEMVPNPQKMAAMRQADLELLLRGCGLFRHKSRYLVEACRMIVEQYGGELPVSFDELVKLPGVGRKTASVIVSSAFGQPAMAVDTHVYRVSRRLGLAHGPGTGHVEEQLKQLLPPGEWALAHHRLIAHGRTICRARRPGCEECFLMELCPHFQCVKSQNRLTGGSKNR